MKIAKACVIGSGVMGSGIAAQIANAGIPVLLLDIVPRDATDRNVLSRSAIARMAKAQPSAFMSAAAVQLVTPGNLEDDLGQISDCDWIVEAIVERADIKQGLYRKLEPFRKPGAILSSNTSTIPLSLLMQDMPDQIRADFCITHFFNPPRFMRLLEIVAGPDSRPDVIDTISHFGDVALGKSVVNAKDRPGFIGNRIGVFFMQVATQEAFALGLTVEEADAILGRPVGMPRTGIFALLDLVGLDLMPDVDASLRRALAPDDPYQMVPANQPLIRKMISEGYTGRKGKGGFYRISVASGKKVKEVIDLSTGTYGPLTGAQLDSPGAAQSGLQALVTHPDRGGVYAWRVLSQLFAYAAALVPEIADDILQVDLAMRTGFNWQRGPFEMMDQLGPAWLAERFKSEGLSVPPLLAAAAKAGSFYRIANDRQEYLSVSGDFVPVVRRPGVVALQDIKRRGPPLAGNVSASIWDIGDGVACLEFHSKMNTLDAASLAMAMAAITMVPIRRLKALVIANDGENFSVGANISHVLAAAKDNNWDGISQIIDMGQKLMGMVKFAPFPIVGAAHGLALGGACELLMHCAAVQAHAETYMGLPETNVGIVPGWGGCKEILLRHQPGPQDAKGPMPAILAAFAMIATSRTSKSAAEAREMRLLRSHDRISMNRDRLLADAKDLALSLVESGYVPPVPAELRLPGATARTALGLTIANAVKLGQALPHDVIVAETLATVLSGGDTDITTPITETQLFALEKQAVMTLLKTPETQARMEALLTTGKPLRN